MSTTATEEVEMEQVTRFTRPCDRCGVDDVGCGVRAASILVTLKSGTLELCGSHFSEHEDALVLSAISIKAIQNEKAAA